MAVRTGVLAAVASVLLLAGCAPAPQLPAPMTQAEAQQRIDDGNRARWESMFPGEPMPQVQPAGYLEPGASWTEITDCLRGATSTDGTLSSMALDTPARERAIMVARFVCQLKYPLDVSDPAKAGFLTEEQTQWIWQYNQTRFLPCVHQLGYAVRLGTADDLTGFDSPILDFSPKPASEREWALIELHCPPSPIGPEFRPTVG
jgi:hypothetical protein